MDQDRTRKLVAEAKKIARRVDSWNSLSNALSDPVGGLIARYFPDAEQRAEFLRSPGTRNSINSCCGPSSERDSIRAPLRDRTGRPTELADARLVVTHGGKAESFD